MNNWSIQELLLVDLARAQYTRDDNGLYFCIKVDQLVDNELFCYSIEFEGVSKPSSLLIMVCSKY